MATTGTHVVTGLTHKSTEQLSRDNDDSPVLRVLSEYFVQRRMREKEIAETGSPAPDESSQTIVQER